MNIIIVFSLSKLDELIYIEVNDFLAPLAESYITSDFLIETFGLKRSNTVLILVNLLPVTNVIAFLLFLVNPLYNSVDIYLEGFAATFALNSCYIYFIENILKLENNIYD